jgi:serine/threonine-protein kinase
MNSEEWSLVKDIFDKALDLPEESRNNFIREQCRGNYKLYSEVESLLNSYDKAGTFIDKGLSLPKEPDEDNDPMLGQVVGHYKIIKRLAGGGMGTVYLGERSDQQYLKQVAIKIINPGISHELIIKRFRNERQALANLDHPNIAKLLDGGTTTGGIPYFIMEYIAGERIDIYCNKNKLKIPERLKLFCTICNAVHYAHQNLIVHRDIKPDNIIVTKDGVPKLLDFGIAKVLASHNNDEYIYDGLTRPGTWHLTPEYASPEQILGETITTSSDIYSLGVLLYVLLTGHHPYKFHNNSPAELNRIVSGVKPEKPSLVVTKTVEVKTDSGKSIVISPEKICRDRNDNPHGLSKSLAGDLDNIIHMAMRKEPSRRYLSVQQFSEDINRHLNGLPVIARRDTFSYRASKFISRHKIGFASVVLIMFILVAGIAAVLWQAGIAGKQRDLAQTEAQKSRETVKFLQDMLSAADPGVAGKDVKVYDLMHQASDKIKRELKNHPGLQAELFSTLGNTYESLGLYDEAEEHLNASLALHKKIYPVNSAEYAKSIKELALLMHYKGKLSSADSLYKISLRIYNSLEIKPGLEYAEILCDYGNLLCEQSRFTESEKYLRRAVKLARSLKTTDDILGSSVNNLAITVDYLGRADEATQLYREAYNFFRNKYGDFHPRVATAINNLAFIHSAKKDYAEAEKLFKQALDMKLKIYGRDNAEMGLPYHNYGAALYLNGKFNEAEKMLYEALNSYPKFYDDNHVYYAQTYHWLGKVFIARKNYLAAESYLRKALALKQKVYRDTEHHSIALSKSELGYCLALQGRYNEASGLLAESYNTLKNKLGDENDFTITAREHLDTFNKLAKSTPLRESSSVSLK